MTKANTPKTTLITDSYPAWLVHHDTYKRKPIERFSTGADDKLMNSLIMKYSHEGNSSGAPNHNYYMTQSDMQAVSKEVVRTHFGWKGQKLDDYLKANFARLWATWDVNRDGFITVDRAPTFLRMLLDNSEISDGLQVQLGENIEVSHKIKKHQKYRPNAVQQPWSLKKEDKKVVITKITDAFPPGDTEVYKRAVPAHFAQEADDRLMHSLISKYAVEGNTDKAPNGHFYMTKEATERAVGEVTETHLEMTGAKKEAWMQEKFTELWPRFDVNEDGFIEVERAATLLRASVGEVIQQHGL